MFGFSPAILIGVAIALALSFTGGFGAGYKYEKANFDAYKLDQIELTRQKEAEHQNAADQLRREKDAKIAAINSKLLDALDELRKRPARPATLPADGQSCTGRSLYSEDASFLIREAARADVIRTALESCYNQYEAVSK